MNELMNLLVDNFQALNKVAVIIINFIAISLLLTVFNHNKFRDKRSQIFGFIGILMLLWVDYAYLARLVGRSSIDLSKLFLRIAWVATPLLFYFTYSMSIMVIGKGKEKKIQGRLLLVVALALSIITGFTNIIIEGIKFTNSNLDVVYGKGFYPFLLVIFIFMFLTLAPAYQKKLNKSVEYFLIGVIVFYVANAMFNIFLPVFLGITYFYYIGDYSTIFLLGFTSYAILKHEFLDIKVISTEILTVSIWTVLLVKILVSERITDAIVDIVVLIAMTVFGILLIRSVIREVKQRERLQVLTKRLKQLDDQKDEFISVAAHELRAPMTAIKGYISMILEGDAGEISKEATEFLQEATEGNERLIHLVNNMLNVSRIEEGRLVYQMGVMNLVEVTETVFDEFKHEAEEKGLEFKLQIPKNIEGRVYVDKERIYEVVVNFISNAIKYTSEGVVEVKLIQPVDDSIRLEVSDTGPGISESDQKKIFKKFFRADSTTGKKVGTGLGLYISKLLIEKFSGKIGFESKLGKGTTFWFELPVKKVAKSKDLE
jgi:signal transduction histidine kinase